LLLVGSCFRSILITVTLVALKVKTLTLTSKSLLFPFLTIGRKKCGRCVKVQSIVFSSLDIVVSSLIVVLISHRSYFCVEVKGDVTIWLSVRLTLYNDVGEQMAKLMQFFWWCSGVHPATLAKYPAEHNKYVGIG